MITQTGESPDVKVSFIDELLDKMRANNAISPPSRIERLTASALWRIGYVVGCIGTWLDFVFVNVADGFRDAQDR